jgi:hypothetical protein
LCIYWSHPPTAADVLVLGKLGGRVRHVHLSRCPHCRSVRVITPATSRIEVAAHTIATLDRRIGRIDSAIQEAAKRGKRRLRRPGRAATYNRRGKKSSRGGCVVANDCLRNALIRMIENRCNTVGCQAAVAVGSSTFSTGQVNRQVRPEGA